MEPKIGGALENILRQSQAADKEDRILKSLGEEYRPHRLAKDVEGRLWEFISYPWLDDPYPKVMVRVPGDPTTMKEAMVFDMDPEHYDCLCDDLGEFYFVDDRNQLNKVERGSS